MQVVIGARVAVYGIISHLLADCDVAFVEGLWLGWKGIREGLHRVVCDHVQMSCGRLCCSRSFP